jgi:hypothetical protein
MDTIQLLGSTMGLGFVAGIRLYSTVLVLGLGMRFGLLQLPAGFEQHAGILSSPIVLATAALAYLAEFFADKVAWVDSLWDAFHTFVRPIGAVVLGATALGSIDPTLKFVAIILCGGIAFTSHTSKAATRLAVNHSPEPFTNIALSLGEDLFAPFGLWLSFKHPIVVLALVCAFLLVFLWISPKAFRLIRLQLLALRYLLPRGSVPANSQSSPLPSHIRPEAASALSIVARQTSAIPDTHARAVIGALTVPGVPLGILCAATKKVTGLRNSIGYFTFCGDELLFVTRRLFKYRLHRTRIEDIHAAQLKRGILMNRLILTMSVGGEISFYLFKNVTIAEYITTKKQRTAMA